MDKNYWEKYYNKHNYIDEPSKFALYVYEKFLKKNSKIVELGCGSGRDSIFFSKNNINTLAIDQCSNVEKILTLNSNMNNLKFMCCDFTSLEYLGQFDGIYSRFTLHSISEEEENSVINWASNCLVQNGKFFIEARSVKNELYKKGISVPDKKNTYIFNKHQRRFIEIDVICEKLRNKNFLILEANEDKNFAISNDENQTFMRIIAEKI